MVRKLDKFGVTGGAVQPPWPIKRASPLPTDTTADMPAETPVSAETEVPAETQAQIPAQAEAQTASAEAYTPAPSAPAADTSAEDLLAPTGISLPPSASRHSSRSTYSYRIVLSARLADLYFREAEARGVDLETVLESRLDACASHSSAKSLYLDAAHTAELERICSRNFMGASSDAADAIKRLTELTSVAVDGLVFSDFLTPVDVERLRSRAEAYHRTYADYLREAMIKGVKLETGQA